MQILLVLVICLAFFPNLPGPTFGGMRWSIGGVAGGLLLLWLAAAAPVWLLTREMVRSASVSTRCLSWYGRVRTAHLFLVMGVYVAALLVFGWGHTVRDSWGLGQTVVVDELLILLPLLLGLAIGWGSFYTVESTLHGRSHGEGVQPFWGRTAYVWFQMRTYVGLLLAPILLFNGVHEVLLWAAPDMVREEWFVLGSAGLLGLLVLAFMPWMLVKIWGARPLPRGPLRDRLEEAGRRLRFRCTDILLWNTRGGMANAMVTGLLPLPRYVMLTDSLVHHLKPEEIEAVFGHEVGHVQHRHMLLYLAFLLLSILALGVVADRLLPAAEMDWHGLLYLRAAAMPQPAHWFSWSAALVLLGVYVWGVFGFLSRRCERQADVFGCKAASAGIAREGADANTTPADVPSGRPLAITRDGVKTFVSALEKVASLNGIGREKPSWRHSSIARRVAFLEGLAEDPAEEPRFQTRFFWTKWGMLAALSAAVLVFNWL